MLDPLLRLRKVFARIPALVGRQRKYVNIDRMVQQLPRLLARV
jgi:hypothetical protein